MRRKESERMGNEAAEHSGELIHYLATEVAPGFVVHMQTMYMTWITMAIVFMLIFFAAKNPKMVPSGVQNVVEFFIDFLNELMEGQLGIKGRKYMAPFIITLFMFIFISNELGLLPQVGVHWTSLSQSDSADSSRVGQYRHRCSLPHSCRYGGAFSR